MRYDWRHILSWTELLCFVLIWGLGIGVTMVQIYGTGAEAPTLDVAAADSGQLAAPLE